MSVQLIPGTRWNVQIKADNGNILYQKPCTSKEDLKNFIHQYKQSRNGWALIEGIATPLRTHNFKDFAKDFFLPSFVNFCLKIDNFALGVIFSALALALDIVTFPIRVLTTPFRIYHNYQHPEVDLPITNLIKENPNYSSVLNDNLVKLCYEVEEVKIIPQDLPEMDENGNPYKSAKRTIIKGGQDIILKQVPGGISTKSFEETKNESYFGSGDKWVFQGRAEDSSASMSYIL